MNPFKRHVCNDCKQRFRTIEELMQHTQVVHCLQNAYECTECRKSFEGMEQMRDHLRRTHSYRKKKQSSDEYEL